MGDFWGGLVLVDCLDGQVEADMGSGRVIPVLEGVWGFYLIKVFDRGQFNTRISMAGFILAIEPLAICSLHFRI
jgi:hypothetical protein